MLPFGKKDNNYAASLPVSKMSRDEDTDFGFLDAIASDLMAAFHLKDLHKMKSALESLCTYIQDQDKDEDQEQFNRGF